MVVFILACSVRLFEFDRVFGYSRSRSRRGYDDNLVRSGRCVVTSSDYFIVTIGAVAAGVLHTFTPTE